MKPGLDYFTSKFQNELSGYVRAFKAAQLFVPSKIAEMRPTAAEIDSLGSFPFFSSIILQNLKAELSLHLAKASSVTVSPEFDTLMWWQNHSSELPNWSEAVKDLVLVQPSSAAAGHVFFST